VRLLVEGGHPRIDLLARGEALRPLLRAVAREVRATDEGGEVGIGDPHLEAAFLDVDDLAGHHRALADVARFGVGKRIPADLLDAERDAFFLDIDIEKERISLGIKQVGGADPFEQASGEIRKGAVVTCEVIDVKEAGIDVKIADTDLTAFIRRGDLSRDRSEQRPERFAKGEKVDARVTNFDKKSRKVSVSIKALEIAEEKEAVAQYGSTDSGASLGDILGAALKAREGDAEENSEEEKADN